MYRVSCEIDFCYGHRLLGHEGKCRYLHGHNGTAVIVLEADRLDEGGMVVDFSDVKTALKERIDAQIDHHTLLQRDDPLVAALSEHDRAPFLMDESPTAENIARLISDWALELGLPIREVCLWETPRCSATYSRPVDP